MESKVTKHVAQWTRERLWLNEEETVSVLQTLSRQGRAATPDDFRLFETIPLPGFAYRVTVFRTRRTILIGCAQSDVRDAAVPP